MAFSEAKADEDSVCALEVKKIVRTCSSSAQLHT